MLALGMILSDCESYIWGARYGAASRIVLERYRGPSRFSIRDCKFATSMAAAVHRLLHKTVRRQGGWRARGLLTIVLAPFRCENGVMAFEKTDRNDFAIPLMTFTNVIFSCVLT